MRVSLIAFSLFCQAAFAWHPTGHFIVARIAELEIGAKNAALLGKLIDLLKVLSPYTKEKNHPFVECACFPDDIKYIGWKAFNQFHFYDYYIQGPGITPDDIKKLPKSKVNMASSIADARETLKNTKASQVDDRLGKSFELRYLIHLIGDVHQPLHSSSRVSKEHPRGDAGGNAFKMSKPKIDLHTYWDKIMGFYTEVKAPLEGKAWDVLEKHVAELMRQYPRSQFDKELADTSVSNWIKAGNKLAAEYGYKNIEEGGEITDVYRNRAKPIMERQLALAGYRLTDYLIETFKDANLNDVFTSHKKDGAIKDDESDNDANNSALVDSSDEDSPKTGDKKGAAKNGKDTPIDTTAEEKKKPATDKKGKKKGADDGKLLTDKKKKAPGKKKFDEDDYDPDSDEDYEEQRSAEMPESEVTEVQPTPGFFSRMFSSIGSFFRKLFGG